MVRAVTDAWLISRQLSPSTPQHIPSARETTTRHFGRDEPAQASEPARPQDWGDDLDDDAIIHVKKRDDVVPIRRGPAIDGQDNDGFWSSHLFWKGIVFGVLAVVFIKTIFDIQAPFGVDWYNY